MLQSHPRQGESVNPNEKLGIKGEEAKWLGSWMVHLIYMALHENFRPLLLLYKKTLLNIR
jgi:hypothetical protein